jgi:zinc and cadmium transporter
LRMSVTAVLIFSLIVGMSTMGGVYLVRFAKNWTKRNSLLMISFAGGVLVATALLEVLPEAAVKSVSWPYAALAGVVVLFIIEHFMAIHECQEETCDIHNIGTVSALGIGIHSFIDGVVIGTGFQAGAAVGIITALAVIVHELPEGAFTYSLLIANGQPERKSMFIGWAVALATPIGTVLTFLLLQGVGAAVVGGMLAFSAGTFLYVGSADLLPQVHTRPNLGLLAAMLAGVAFVILMRSIFG